MRLGLAIKAFIKAFKYPQEAEKFLSGEKKAIEAPQDHSHIRLLAEMQQSGRLIDFLKEDISGFSDAEVGAAVRKIHEDCGRFLEEAVTVRPVMDQAEGSQIQIHKGFDPAAIKIIGKVKGEPPYSGTLVHRGWKAHKRSLPKKQVGGFCDIIYPAEVEIK